MIIIFRGKAATGKSLIASKLSDSLDIEIISKDSVFDILLEEGYSWTDANKVTYDKLASLIQKYHDEGNKVIVDLGLAHTEYYDQFMSKMILHSEKTKKYLFTCSDDDKWEERMQKRILNPKVLNQAFKSIIQAREYYKKYNITARKDEVIIDSILPIDEIHSKIFNEITGK